MILTARVRHKTHRLIASRHPAIGVFDDLTADKGDLRAAFLLEALTNDRHLGLRLNLLPDSEIIPGPSGSLVIAAFLHADAAGGRFTDGRLGGWYAGFDRDTAIAETLYHNTRRLAFSDAGVPEPHSDARSAGDHRHRACGASRPEICMP